jgi:hypothetical protein
MSGAYPNTPAWRIPYDLGGAAYNISSANVPTAGDINSPSDESSSSVSVAASASWGLLLDRPYTLTGIFAGVGHSAFSGMYSTDTTSLLDGTWTGFPVTIISSNAAIPYYRTSITAVNIPGVVGIRLRNNSNIGSPHTFASLHLYGYPTSAVDGLMFWDPVEDYRLPSEAMDFGDIPQLGTFDSGFRVKNLSSQTANNIVLSFAVRTDTVPTYTGQYLMSNNGGASFVGTYTIPTLAPGSVSSVGIVRRAPSSTAQISLSSARLLATAGSWT